MDDLCLVEVVQTAQNIVDDRFNLSLFQVLARLDKLPQIHVTFAQDEIDFIELQVFEGNIFLTLDVARRNHRKQLVAAGVLHLLQDVHFAK